MRRLLINHVKHIFKKYLENKINLVLSEIAVIKSFYTSAKNLTCQPHANSTKSLPIVVIPVSGVFYLLKTPAAIIIISGISNT
jgi:hypothetical protein